MAKKSPVKTGKKWSFWRIPTDTRKLFLFLGLANFVLVVLRAWHLKKVDSDFELRIRRECSRDLIERFDKWAASASSVSSTTPLLAPESETTPVSVSAPWSFCSDGKKDYVLADGQILGVGDFTEFGEIRSISKRCCITDRFVVVLRSGSFDRIERGVMHD